MNKSELIKEISLKTGMTVKDTTTMFNETLNTFKEALVNGKQITLVDFGTLLKRERNDRIGRNPKTGEKVNIPKTQTVIFKIGRGLRNDINT